VALRASIRQCVQQRSWGDGVVEVSTVEAMGFYLLIFALIGMLVTALAPRLSGHTGGAA